MTESPPTRPGTDSADDAALSVQEQLDRLLAQIETQEPGSVDPDVLPAGFGSPAASPAAPPAASIADELDEAMHDFEQALAEPDSPEPAPAGGDSESDMLAALNAALKDLNPGKPAPENEPLAKPEAGKSFDESSLQDEIAELLNAPPQEDTEPEPAPPATTAPQEAEVPAQASTEPPGEASTQDQIAAEIESLLDADAQASELQEADGGAEADDHASIDELDHLLAEEIDEDDELAGDFQSVADITAGIDTGEDEAIAVDEHAATARDVAAELDSQLEHRDDNEATDPEAILSKIAATAEQNAQAYEREQAGKRGWREHAALAKERLLRACFLLNWPARRYLSPENRANLGYIALLNLFGAAAVWLYLILF